MSTWVWQLLPNSLIDCWDCEMKNQETQQRSALKINVYFKVKRNT